MSEKTLTPRRRRHSVWDILDVRRNIYGSDWINQPYNRVSNTLQHLVTGIYPFQSKSSEVYSDSSTVEVKLDCSHFNAEEIEVKTIDNYIGIHGKHEEKKDPHGWVTREFTRKYEMPEDCDFSKLKVTLNDEGIMTVRVPKKQSQPLKENEKLIPITLESSSPQTEIKTNV